MRVCLVTSEPASTRLGRRVSALAALLDEPTVATTRRLDWPGAVVVDELDRAFDVAVAFGWQACLHLARTDAGAYAYFVPALEDALMWQGDERRVPAGLTYDLPLQLVTDSQAVADGLRARNPDARIGLIPRGCARPPAAAPSAPRVDAGAPADAERAGASASESHPLRVLVAAADPAVLERAGALAEPIVPSADPWNDYARADVVLELAGAEQPLEAAPEAMLCGCVPVVTPVRGYAELVDDGRTGIVVGFDDVPGAARVLETLSRDRDQLRALGDNARAAAAGLPSLEDAARAFAELLGRLEPGTAELPRRLLLSARAAIEPVERERRALEEALRRRQQDVDELLPEVDRLRAERDAARELVEQQRDAARVGHALAPAWRPLLRLRRRLKG